MAIRDTVNVELKANTHHLLQARTAPGSLIRHPNSLLVLLEVASFYNRIVRQIHSKESCRMHLTRGV